MVRNACIISLVFIVLNAMDGFKSNYPSVVFLSISSGKQGKKYMRMG